jgi:hypothetical protein
MPETEFTTDQKTEISRAFDAGNYANAYEGTDLEDFDEEIEALPSYARPAFVLGFFGSYALDEISGREAFDDAYWSATGRYVVGVAGYCDDRADEYAAEASD